MSKPKATQQTAGLKIPADNEREERNPGVSGSVTGARAQEDEDDESDVLGAAIAGKAKELGIDKKKPAVKAAALEDGDTEEAEPVKPKAKLTKDRQALLDAILKESEARVDYEHFLNQEEGKGNIYDIPEHLVPEGATVEWKNTHVMGQPVPSTEYAAYEMAGWRPAPADLFREMLPEAHEGPTIERGGMVLMIRSANITERFRRQDKQKARDAVRNKVNEMSGTKDGEMDRVVHTLKQTKVARVAIEED